MLEAFKLVDLRQAYDILIIHNTCIHTRKEYRHTQYYKFCADWSKNGKQNREKAVKCEVREGLKSERIFVC